MTDTSADPLGETNNMLAAMSKLLQRLHTSSPAVDTDEGNSTCQSSDNLRAELAVQSSDQLRAELVVARLREVDVVQREQASECRSQELEGELYQSHEHSHLIEEYAERLQAVIGLRDSEVADLRSELQFYRRSAEAPSTLSESPPSFAWQPQFDVGQDCERVRVKWDQVASLRQELASLGEPFDRKDLQLNTSPAGKLANGLGRYGTECSNGHATESAKDALWDSCWRSLQETGHLPVRLDTEFPAEMLCTELSACLRDNAQLKCSAEDLAVETEDALRQERELREICFEQSARLDSAEEAAEDARTERNRESELAERNEKAWQEEAKIARQLKCDLDAKMHAVSDLSQMVRKGVDEVAMHEGVVAAAEQKSRSLQAELYVQKAQTELLRSELRHSVISSSRHAADQEFEEHVREVMEIAATFRTELSCVEKAGGSVANRELEAMNAYQPNEELEAHLQEARSSKASAVQHASYLSGELDMRDKEIARLKSELRLAGSVGVKQEGGSLYTRGPNRSKSPNRIQICAVPSGMSILSTATPPRRSSTLPLQATTTPMSATPPAFRLGVHNQTSGAATPQTTLRVNLQEHLSAGTPTPVRLGARERLAFSPAPAPCTRILPVGSHSVLQAESAAIVHERLRQRILGSSSVDASAK